MIDEKKIEEAIEDYVKYSSVEDEYPGTEGKAFKVGAEWAINEFLKNLWHNASEEPKDKSSILLKYTGTMCEWATLDEVDANDWKQTVKELGITRWLYIDDLLKEANNG